MAQTTFFAEVYPTSTLEKDSSISYLDAHDAAIGTLTYSELAVGQKRFAGRWQIMRSPLIFDTSSLPDDLVILQAKLSLLSKNVYAPPHYDIVIVRGYDLHVPPVGADYGELLDEVASKGSINSADIPPATWVDIGLDSSEISKTGYTKLALRSSHDIDSIPTSQTYLMVRFHSGYPLPDYAANRPKLIIEHATPGYIWVEETNFAYIDYFGTKRLKEGALTGVTGKLPGYTWIDGPYKYYVDAAGAVRRIQGTLTGLTGKLPSQISINTAQGGTKYCYIDSTGAERCFEGTAA